MGGSSPPPTPSPTPPPSGKCPETLDVVLTGPEPGIVPNSWLDVYVDRSAGSPRVLVRDPVRQIPVGAVAGIPELAQLVICLERKVEYKAYVSAVEGGRVDVLIMMQE